MDGRHPHAGRCRQHAQLAAVVGRAGTAPGSPDRQSPPSADRAASRWPTWAGTPWIPPRRARRHRPRPLQQSDHRHRRPEPLGRGTILLRHASAPPRFHLEVEPNDFSTGASRVSIAHGTGIYGTSTGSQVSADPALTATTSCSTCPPPRRESTATVCDHLHAESRATPAALRGDSQLNGVIDSFSDVAFQTSSAQSSPARFSQWYGFGRGEQVAYRIDGSSLTTSEYVSTLSSTLVTPIAVSGAVQSGPVTIAAPRKHAEHGAVALRRGSAADRRRRRSGRQRDHANARGRHLLPRGL